MRGQGGKAARRQERSDPERQEQLEFVEIWPEPSPEEREAILVALEQALYGAGEMAAPQLAAWAAAGRREAVFTRANEHGSGWDRNGERLTAW